MWDFETIDTADIVDDSGLLEMEHMNELLVGKHVNLNCMVKIHERGEPFWYAQVRVVLIPLNCLKNYLRTHVTAMISILV